jgi:hypothetical protein
MDTILVGSCGLFRLVVLIVLDISHFPHFYMLHHKFLLSFPNKITQELKFMYLIM